MPTDRLQRVLIWLLIAAVGVFLLERLFVLVTLFATPLLLFALAWLIALVLQPMIAWMTALTLPVPFISRRIPGTAIIAPGWRLPRALAVLLVYLVLLAVVVFLIILLVPVIGSQLAGLETTLPDASGVVLSWATSLEEEAHRFGLQINLASVLQPDVLMQQATAVGTALIGQSLGIVSGIAILMINLVLVFILSFYMTLDGPRLASRVLEILPFTWRGDTLTLFAIVNRTFGGFLRAQIVQALFYGLATAVLMVALGLSDVALASVLAAILVLIPLIGGFIAIIPPLVIVLIENPDRFVITLIGLLIIQQILFNMIMPRLMGRIVGLHPLLVFAAILAGAVLAGAWGILFGVPIAGVTASVLQFIHLRATTEPDTVATETPAMR
ncbi:MAG TPA: AI-2E family transporter [Roseiflexaceae bacterium]|jgi:predicted PurR-regulated permease PerM